MTKALYEIEGGKYVNELALKLKALPEFEMPEWARYVKTGAGKERPPAEENWWYVRAASVLRQIYLKGVVGVTRLSTKYGNKMSRGMRPPKFSRGSRKVIRVILQQAEKAGFMEKVKEPRAGRRLTAKGKEFLNNAFK